MARDDVGAVVLVNQVYKAVVYNTCVVEDELTFQKSQRQSENCVEEHSETHQGTE